MPRPLILVLLFLVLAPGAAWAEEGHANESHHGLELFVGAGVETHDGHKEDSGIALGLEYEYRFHRRWSVGAVVEALGNETKRAVLVVAPVSFHPHAGWRLIAGPGVEFKEGKTYLAGRLGVAYEFHLGGKWALAPEAFLDMAENGGRAWVGGLALVHSF